MRLDQVVAARYPEVSRRKAREMIAQKRVLVNDRPVAVASREVHDSDRVILIDAAPDLQVIRESSDWIAVDKPPGMPTQPTRDRHRRSLEELLRRSVRTLYLIHRLDTQTSGVVVFAKNKRTAAELSALFASRDIRKTYLAVVEGLIDRELVIESPVGGKDAHTVVRPLQELEGATLIEAEILTGRTHQIRVHMKSIERPVVGDRRYGSTIPAARMFLHSWKLEHALFGGELIAAPPGDFPLH